MSKTVLDVKNLSKNIGKKSIIQSVNFDVKEGEVFGLLGPNGAGKTTIIRAIVGLVSRSSGSVLINGEDTSIHFRETIAEVGAIIENPEFYMYLSGMDNLKLLARMNSNSISDSRLYDVVEQVKLTEAIHQKVKTYSLGMRQRLGLAQALIHNPSLLILDEPTNGLDPQGMLEFRDIIQTISNQGTSVLISSHLLGEIQQITHRFAIIEKGRITHIETMNNPNESKTITYRIDISNSIKAQEALMKKQIEATIIDDHLIDITLEKKQMPFIVKELVINKIDLYSIEPKQVSLEDRFFELTKGEQDNV